MADNLLELRIAQLQSNVADIRSDIAEMKRRERLESLDREWRRELAIDWSLMLLQTTILVLAWAHGFN